jgi:hypothetical protein
MKRRIVVFLMLVAGLVGIQGCGQGGEWFPKSDKPVRKRTSLDKESGKGRSALNEWEEGREYPVTILNGHVNYSNYK